MAQFAPLTSTDIGTWEDGGYLNLSGKNELNFLNFILKAKHTKLKMINQWKLAEYARKFMIRGDAYDEIKVSLPPPHFSGFPYTLSYINAALVMLKSHACVP